MSPPTLAVRLPEVSLCEINDTAPLMRRVDRKYALTPAEADAVLDFLPEGTRALTIDGQQEFDYLSTYFDTYAWDAYLLAARGRQHRFKVRIRHYDSTDEAYLEVKTREDGQTVKRRVPHDPRSMFEVHPEQHEFLTSCLTSGLIPGINPECLLPVLQTSYRRTTLLCPDASSRVTVDHRLHWHAMGAGRTDAPDLVVVETKSPGAAGDVDRILWSMGHSPTRISKYATGLARLRPELPTNRWHRVMRTQFS
ncbi:MAG: polyphosphate polymerase domain-containing protein [Arachnia sp.]